MDECSGPYARAIVLLCIRRRQGEAPSVPGGRRLSLTQGEADIGGGAEAWSEFTVTQCTGLSALPYTTLYALEQRK